jgi:hypothetical protein
VVLIVFWPITQRVSLESKYSLSLETISLLETLLSSPGEVNPDPEEEEEGVGYNHIEGLLNQTSNGVTYTNRIDGRIILIKRANSGRSSTQLRSSNSP